MNTSDRDIRGGNQGHVDEMSCLQYLEGVLERPRALELSAHTEHCSDCRALLRALERETRLLSFALREQEESIPVRLLSGPARERTPWGWIVSFGLGAAGAYWLWTSIIDPLQAQMAQAGFGGTDLMTMLFIRGTIWKGWENMWTMIQAFAVISLGLVGFLVLRRSLRRWNTIALLMAAVVGVLVLPFGVQAMEVHKSEPNYTLSADKTVKGDLFILGNNVRIDGTVDGDLYLIGQSFTINGHVTGDVIAAGTLLQLNGQVDGNVRGSVSMFNLANGRIGKNITGFAGIMTMDSKSEIGWGVILYGGDISLDGRIGRGVFGRMGQLSLGGNVGGDIDIKVKQSVRVGPEAQLQGKIQVIGPTQPVVAAGAKLASPIDVKIEETTQSPDFVFSAMSLWHRILTWGAAFVFGLVLLFVAPGFFNETVHTADRIGLSLGVGALVLIATPVLAIIACFTVVGLGIGISTVLLYMIATYASKILFAAWLGRGIMIWGRSKSGESDQPGHATSFSATASGAVIGQLALGLVVLYGIRMVPYYIGFFAICISLVWGFGAIAVTLFNRMRPGSLPGAVTVAN